MKFKNIFLVDDDADDQEFFKSALNIVSETVVFKSANNGKEAIAMLEENAVEPEVIFLDWNMPIMNGQEFLEEIKKHQTFKNIPVIILSTSSHYQTITLSRELGAKDFITKPNNFGDLVEILSGFIQR
ncbi:MAG: response regulator [Bacteroidia bacterium]|nr:response regulator [Bacteroidia bacterium]